MGRKADPKVRRRWSKLVEEFQSFEGTVVAFCARHGVSPNSFFSWRRKLAGGRTKRSGSRRSSFAPVQVSSSSMLPVQVHLPGGGRVEISAAHRELVLDIIERASRPVEESMS